MDRETIKGKFNIEILPNWLCPTCARGSLTLKKESFLFERVPASDAAYNEISDPEVIQYIYSCLFVCSNARCKEIVGSTGTGEVIEIYDFDENGEPIRDYLDLFTPKLFEPHLAIISIPEKCPDSVENPMKESFRLFFSSPGAAANNIRIALEELLTVLKVKRYKFSKGRRFPITLHHRINLLPAKYKELKEIILAIKWLGNAGSHAGNGENSICIDDVLNSYEMMEHVLHEIYEPKSKKLSDIAKKVNKRKGP